MIFAENFNTFTASGFTPTPGAGQLDSDTYSITNFSEGTLNFGGTETGGDFARGITAGATNTGGIYSFNLGGGNFALGIQPTGGDFTPGSIIVRLENTTGTTINSLDIAYDIVVFNDQPRANSFNFSYSEDGITYTPVPALDFTSVEAAAGIPTFEITPRSTTLTGLNVANGGNFFLNFTGDDVSGSSNRDQFGLDNLIVTAPTFLAIAPTDANKAEGDTGTTSFTFTVTRSGDTSGITDVNFAVTGTADAADFGGAVPSGTVNFAANASTETVTIQVSGDTDVEPNENFTVTLSGATGGATITTAAATGTIQNDDTGPTPTPTPTPTTPLPPPPTFVSMPTLGAIAGSITLDSTANTLVQDTLTLSNTGSAPLQLQSLTPQFTAPLPNGIAPTEVLLLDPATGAIAPGETLTVQLTLRDDLLPGDYSGTLAIATNDLANPSVTVPFSGNVTLPKAMDVAPVYGAQLPSNTPIWTPGDDTIVGADIDGDGRQWLNGSSGDDLIFGNLDRDVLTGGPGNDSLFGGRGDDFLRGADGDDLLAGDRGDDTLQGNDGADGFVLAEGFGSDVILDFEDGSDRLLLAAPLTFESLTLQSQGNSTQILAGGEILATVIGVDNSLLTSADFSSF
ncbi:MAG: hypothetical protein AAF685_13845 [Cyanobacteria bacterium P01_C01_bin.89]